MGFNANSRPDIEALFSLEGDALMSKGFKEPDFSSRPKGFGRAQRTATFLVERESLVDYSDSEGNQLPQPSLGTAVLTVKYD